VVDLIVSFLGKVDVHVGVCVCVWRGGGAYMAGRCHFCRNGPSLSPPYDDIRNVTLLSACGKQRSNVANDFT